MSLTNTDIERFANEQFGADPHGDGVAVRSAAAADLSSAQRSKVWKNRFNNSGAIEREFFSVAVYSAHMENLFNHHLRGTTPRIAGKLACPT